MKPNFHIVWDGTHKLFDIAYYHAKKGQTIPHEGALPPFNSTITGYLFSDLEAAQKVCASMNRSMRKILSYARKNKKREETKTEENK